MLITDGLAANALRIPSQPAIRAGDTAVTYADLWARVRCVAAGIQATLPDRSGDVVTMAVPEPTDFLATFLGIVAAGHLAAPLGPGWTAEDVALAEALVSPRLVVNRGTAPSPNGHPNPPAGRAKDWTSPGGIQSSADFYVGFSSGSTGAPKAIARSHAAWLNSFLGMSVEFGIGAQTAVVVPGSLFFSFSLIAVLHALFVGATVVLPAAPGPAGVASLLDCEGAALYVLPSLLGDVVAAALRRGRSYPAIRQVICAGEKLQEGTRAEAARVFPRAAILEYYGASELGFVTLLRPEDAAAHPGSVGRPFLGASVAVLDAEGQPVAAGTVGILCARTEYGFSGYRGQEGSTDPTAFHGWRTAGDLARQDEDGFVYLAGRRDNLLVIRGENVFPEEVEEVLVRHPSVAAAAVSGEPAGLPTRLVALVEVVGERPTAAELVRWCSQRLARRKVPRRIQFVDALPRTATGKVARGELRALLAETRSRGNARG